MIRQLCLLGLFFIAFAYSQDTNWVNLIKPNMAGLTAYQTGSYSVIGDTALRVSGNNSYIVTTNSYSHYITRMDYRFESTGGNTGFLYHVQNDQIWPRGLELQWMTGDAGSIWTTSAQITFTTPISDTGIAAPHYRSADSGGVVDSLGKLDGRYHVIRANGINEKPNGQWNTFELQVNGDSLTTILNGKVTFKGWGLKIKDGTTTKWIPLTNGRFGPQAEGTTILMRNWKMVNLSGTTPVFKTQSNPNNTIKFLNHELQFPATMNGLPTLFYIYNAQGQLTQQVMWVAGTSLPKTLQQVFKTKANQVIRWHNRQGQGTLN